MQSVSVTVSVYTVLRFHQCVSVQCLVSTSVSVYTVLSFHHCVNVHSVKVPSLCHVHSVEFPPMYQCTQCWVSVTVYISVQVPSLCQCTQVLSFSHCVHKCSGSFTVSVYTELSFHHCVHNVEFPSLCQCTQCCVSITVSLYTVLSFHHCVTVYSVEFPSPCHCIQRWVSITVSLYTVLSFHHCVTVYCVEFPSLCHCIQCWVPITVSLYTVLSFHHCVHSVSFPYLLAVIPGCATLSCPTLWAAGCSSYECGGPVVCCISLACRCMNAVLSFFCMPLFGGCIEFLLLASLFASVTLR